MKEIIVLGGKLYVQEKANNIIAKDGALYACDYEPDPNPENWRTINGVKVHINNEGYIDGGAGGKFNGQSYKGTKKQAHAGESTGEKPEAKNGKSDVGEKGIAYLRSISHVNSSAEEETGYTARTMIDMINKGKTLEEIRTELRKNIDKYSHDTDNDYQHLDKMIEAVKKADKGEAKETKPAGNKDVRVKLPNGVTLRWREVPGEPDKVYNPETHTFYHLKGGIEAAIERAKSQGAEIEDYEKSPSDPYQAESKNRQDRRLARSAAATRRAAKHGRPVGAR